MPRNLINSEPTFSEKKCILFLSGAIHSILSRWNKYRRTIWDSYFQTAEQLGNEFTYLTYFSSAMNQNHSTVGIKKKIDLQS